ncbi:sigma-54-dependent transcriptional regulator [Methylocella silvestris]|uniref:DNA-binding transcriptional regulator NtrC n=1 Tax=Methylocella silvestris TaxID=199596 RepID=A0A2J7TF87_METSI|nr:sigma-54 dependent transcriptional regulator [Methylocella silvestris]PNG25426.1 sigma-54-dependent Fis family transcriptional regulator [Methylocella silvestris]
MSPRILIVDDDPIERQLAAEIIRKFGFATETADGGEAALARLKSAGAAPVDLLLLDLTMPDLDGLGVIARLRAEAFTPPIVVQTTSSSVEAASSALCAGALDFVVKPASPERLKAAIGNGLRLAALEAELRRAARQASGHFTFADYFGAGEEIERAIRLADRAAKTAMPVLIEGEEGAGKETMARAIHAASDRRGRPFVTLRCAGLAAADMETLLFGDIGAGPGAKRPGKIAEAQGGSLYIADVCELSQNLQARLLRLVRDGEIDFLRGPRPVRADVRLIASTRRNLIERVKARRFREDLYYRLNVYPIFAPPLRRRRDEIEGLARGFCARFAAEAGKILRGPSVEAVNLLSAYDWPKNIRQLETAMFRAVAFAEGADLTVMDFPQIAAQVGGFDVRIPPLPLAAPEPAAPFGPERPAQDIRDPNALALIDSSGDMRRLAELEAEAIRFALGHYRGRMSKMAKKLGIGRSTLYRKMKEYGFADAAPDEAAVAEGGDLRQDLQRTDAAA